MDTYSSPYTIPNNFNNSLHNEFPHSLLRTRQQITKHVGCSWACGADTGSQQERILTKTRCACRHTALPIKENVEHAWVEVKKLLIQHYTALGQAVPDMAGAMCVANGFEQRGLYISIFGVCCGINLVRSFEEQQNIVICSHSARIPFGWLSKLWSLFGSLL